MSDARQAGIVLFYVQALDDQQQARRFDIIQGILRADNGWIYAWKLGHSYRDFTTMDKLQPGCRVSFEVMPDQPYLATGLSCHYARACDCIVSGNPLKPKQHDADPHAKDCAIYQR